MSDPTNPTYLDNVPDRRIQRPKGAVRARSARSSGLPLAPPKAAPCVLDLLGRARFQACGAMESII
jgi:hypothetical protein